MSGRRRIRILFYAHGIDYAGTWRGHEAILAALDRRAFDPWVFYWPGGEHPRLPHVRRLLARGRLVPFWRTDDRTSWEDGWRPRATDFAARARHLGFDIVHVARAGYYEWPLTERLAPLQIETNTFGDRDASPYRDRSIAPSRYVATLRGGADAVVYHPTPPAARRGPTLRRELGIPPDAVVCGRIGRPDNFHPIALAAFRRLVAERPNLYFLIVAPCPEAEAYVRAHRIPNVVLVPPTADDARIAAFHRTLDVFLHYRVDGETASTALQQALMFGVPVVSHVSTRFQGQGDTIGDGGHVARDEDEYRAFAARLIDDPRYRRLVGDRGRARARRHFDQRRNVRVIERLYRTWLAEARAAGGSGRSYSS